MTIQEKLEHLLEKEGFTKIELYPARGYWRSSHQVDVYRWEGAGVVEDRKDLPKGMNVIFSSWDTMTKCVNKGIVLGVGDSGLSADFSVYAKE